jgi:glucose uptake protein GlcU
MKLTRRSLAVIVISVTLLGGAIWCFAKSVQYWDAGIMYVAETSSNPYPSERAKVMGPLLMGQSRTWLRRGVILTGFTAMVLLVNWAASNKALQLTAR